MVVCNRDCPVLLQVRFSCLLHWYLVQWWSVVYKMQRTSLCTGKVFFVLALTACSVPQRLPCFPAGSCSLSWLWQPVVYHRDCPVSLQVAVLCPNAVTALATKAAMSLCIDVHCAGNKMFASAILSDSCTSLFVHVCVCIHAEWDCPLL